LGAVFAQIPFFTKVLKLDKVSENLPEWVSNHYKKGDKYQDAGNLEEMPIAKKSPNIQKN